MYNLRAEPDPITVLALSHADAADDSSCVAEKVMVARASAPGVHRVRKITYQQLHDAGSHLGEHVLKNSVGSMQHVLMVGPRTLKPCVVCGIAKMTEQHLERSESTVYQLGELIMVDIQFPNVPAIITDHTCCIVFVEKVIGSHPIYN